MKNNILKQVWANYGQIWLITCFLYICKVRMVFTFVTVENNFKEEYDYYTKSKFQCPSVKFYWNIAALICLQIVYGCFGAIVAKVRKETGSDSHKA